MSEAEEETKKVTDLSDSDVVSKYRAAAEILNKTLGALVTKIVPGADVAQLCELGDLLVTKQCEAIFKKKKGLIKGVAFPTCISVNECVCHYSPFLDESMTLKAGDIVKIDLGCHIDGFITVVAHTLVPPFLRPSPQANVILAAKTAMDVVHRLIRPGVANKAITEAIGKVASEFGVNLCQGVLTHQMKQFIIDGNKVVIEREEPDQKVDDFVFEMYEVYAIDIVMTSGLGKPRDVGTRTTVYKRAVDQTYMLKLKCSRLLISEVDQSHPTLPFTLRSLKDAKQSKMGVKDCVAHGLLHSYPVLYEKEGTFVAHFKTTVLILPSGADAITMGPEITGVSSSVELSPETKAILETVYYKGLSPAPPLSFSLLSSPFSKVSKKK